LDVSGAEIRCERDGCGQDNRPAARFCSRCGQELSAEAPAVYATWWMLWLPLLAIGLFAALWDKPGWIGIVCFGAIGVSGFGMASRARRRRYGA
jgi:hypothetical protein